MQDMKGKQTKMQNGGKAEGYKCRILMNLLAGEPAIRPIAWNDADRFYTGVSVEGRTNAAAGDEEDSPNQRKLCTRTSAYPPLLPQNWL